MQTKDAKLIARCIAWLAGWRALQTISDPRPDLPAAVRSRRQLDRIVATRAATEAGRRAKAAVLGCLDGDHPALAASLAADLV